MIKLIVFDLDGTLIDSVPDLTDAANHVRTEFGLPILSQVEVRNLVGDGSKRFVEQVLPEFGEEEHQKGLELFLDYNFRHIADKTDFYPGVTETLECLKSSGYILVIVSNKYRSHCKEILRLLKADNFFSAILGADSLPERKPSPTPVIHLMKQFCVSEDETVMIGDSINDIAAGKSAGVLTIGCDYGYGKEGELRDADHTVSEIRQVIPFLAAR